MYRFIWIILVLGLGCKDGQKTKSTLSGKLSLNIEIAENLSKLPLKCLQKEYPNKLNQSLGDSTEYGTPKELHPSFYGCYDWHSSVHGHWMLVHLLRKYPQLSSATEIKRILTENITASNVAIEAEYFKRGSEKSFERTYGWAWLLKLDEALMLWNDPIAKELRENLKPLTTLIVSRYLEFLPKLNYPIRSGEHPNTAFGLSLSHDFAVTSQNKILEELINKRAKDFFMKDRDCPISWEPSGFDFLSPCLQEADLMARVLSAQEFKVWFGNFLPPVFKTDFILETAKVSDRTDGKLVHLDGVNFCRAWSLYKISKKIPELNHLTLMADEHIQASLNNIADGSYEGEHWLASFAIYALSSHE